MGLGKSKCDVPNSTTQGWVCFFIVGYSSRSLFFLINNLMHEKFKIKKKSLKYKAKKGYNLHSEHFEK